MVALAEQERASSEIQKYKLSVLVITSLSELSVLAANTNHPLPHTLPHTDALTCMHVHVRKLNSCITLI